MLWSNNILESSINPDIGSATLMRGRAISVVASITEPHYARLMSQVYYRRNLLGLQRISELAPIGALKDCV